MPVEAFTESPLRFMESTNRNRTEAGAETDGKWAYAAEACKSEWEAMKMQTLPSQKVIKALWIEVDVIDRIHGFTKIATPLMMMQVNEKTSLRVNLFLGS